MMSVFFLLDIIIVLVLLSYAKELAIAYTVHKASQYYSMYRRDKALKGVISSFKGLGSARVGKAAKSSKLSLVDPDKKH